MKLAPIVLFAYNRPDCLSRALSSLRANPLAEKSDLFIFVDGPRHEKDAEPVSRVRELVNSLHGFRNVYREIRNENLGLAKSVIMGVSKVIQKYGRAIVMEDDLFLSSNFLDYMNQALACYESEQKVFSVSGFGPAIHRPGGVTDCNYFFPRAHSWGWGTWLDRWEKVDWSLRAAKPFLESRGNRLAFNRLGTDMSKMLCGCAEGRIDSWYIRFAFAQYLEQGLTSYPYESKVVNCGFLARAIHCDCYNRYHVDFDYAGNPDMELCKDLQVVPSNSKGFLSYYSVPARMMGKIKNILLKHRLIKQYEINFPSILK